MKRLLLCLTLSLTASASFAADAIVEEVVVETAPVFIWTGGYVGIQAGYAYLPVDVTNFGSEVWRASPDTNAFAVGAFAGYRYQFDSGLVFGAEADVGWLNGDDTDTYDLGAPTEVKFDPKWDASIRATAGFAMGRFLPYVTGGVAFLDYDFEPNQPDSDEAFGDTVTGWTVGVGAAYAFTDNLIAQLDYRYADFGTETFDTSDLIGDTTDVDVQMHKVMLGISYKF